MKVGFGPALPVGTAGDREYVDVWLSSYMPAPEARERMAGALPEGLSPLDARYVAGGIPALTAGVLIGEYDVAVQGEEVDAGTTQSALDALMVLGELAVEHKGKTKVFDLARSLPKEPHAREVGGTVHVDVTVRMGPEGSLRPEVLLRCALESSGKAGVVAAVMRTDTLIEVEEGVWSRPL
jgi:radical SAM-linked protein